MSVPKEIESENIRLIEGQNRRLGYAQEFKDIIHEHPGVLGAVVRLTRQGENEYNPPNILMGKAAELRWNKDRTEFEVFRQGDQILAVPKPYREFIWGRGVILVPSQTLRDEETGLELTVLGISDRQFKSRSFGSPITRIDKTSYLKVQLGDTAFFVKKSTSTNNPGFEEFKNSNKAKTALSGLKDLQVVEAQFGYADNHQSWFVSKWEELESTGFFPNDAFIGGTPNDYGRFLTREEERSYHRQPDSLSDKVESTIKQIKAALSEVGISITDLNPNLFVNPKTGKLFLLDVTDRHVQGLGQPKRY